MNTTNFHPSLRSLLLILALLLVSALGLTACRASWGPLPEIPAESSSESTDTSAANPDSTDESGSESDATSSESEATDSESDATDSESEEADSESADTSFEESSATETPSEEETTAPEPQIAYTVTVTNACGFPLSGIYVTVYSDVINNPSVMTGITGADGTYTAMLPKDSYHAKAVTTGLSSFAKDAAFEGEETNLTIVLGDHPEYCTCTDTEESTLVEEPVED